MPFITGPGLLGAVGVAQAGLGIVHAIQGVSQAKAVSKTETAQIQADTKRETEALAIERRRLLGRQRVAAASGGVSTGIGSPLDVQLETLGMARKELEDIMLTGARKIKASKLTAASRRSTAIFGGASDVFGGLGTLATASISRKP